MLAVSCPGYKILMKFPTVISIDSMIGMRLNMWSASVDHKRARSARLLTARGQHSVARYQHTDTTHRRADEKSYISHAQVSSLPQQEEMNKGG